MAFQSQTYGNSNSGYYVESAAPINPSTVTALNGPVEILFTSTIAGAYHGTLNQTPSTFIISENDANLSTINSLVMDPTVPKTTMNIYNLANPNSEPVIQQWSHTSSIVNGIFKIGNKQLNDEPNALDIINSNGVTTLTQVFGSGPQKTQITIDGNNQRTRIGNTQTPTKYSEFLATNANSGNITSANDTLGFKITTTPDQQQFIKNTSQIYGRTGVNSAAPNQYYMSARSNIDFTTDELGASLNTLSLKQNGTANFISTVFAPTVSSVTVNTVDVIATNANLDNISTLRINQKGAVGTPVAFNGSLRIRTEAGPNGAVGINYLQSPRIRVQETFISPKVYYPAGNSESQVQNNVLQGTFGAPTNASNSMEFINNSQNTTGGFQFFHGTDGNTAAPEWMGGFQWNPKQFLVASTIATELRGGTLTTILNATLSTITTNAIANFSHKTPNSIITNANSATIPPGPYPTAYGNFQGQLMYNTLRSTFGAPATAFESLEVVNVAGGPQTGGIQFYTSDNSNPSNPKWMGGFLQNNVGAGQSEFRLASTVTASLPQIVNVSTINTQPISAFGNPVGTIISFAAWNPPVGYLRCDGSLVSQSAYPALYAVIGDLYGFNTPAGSFFLPDLLGKTMMGALAEYNKSYGPPPNISNYTADVVFQGRVTGISNPTNTITTGLYFSTPGIRPVTQGMVLLTTAGVTSASYRVQFVIAGDSRTIYSPNRGFLVMFESDVTAVSIAQGTVLSFGPNPANTTQGQNYPQLGAGLQDGNIGVGSMNMWQGPDQVGSHRHGGTPNTNGGLFVSGAPEAGRGAQSDSPNGCFSFTAPAFNSLPAFGVNAPRTMNSLPYNMGVTMCIKF